jgi:hypothetical protein
MTETIYLNRENKFDLLLKIDGEVANLSDLNKVEILFQENYYDSDNFPSAFDYATRATAGIITFDLMSIASFEAGQDRKTELIVYDNTNPDGHVWGTFDLIVKELEGTEVTP